MCAVNPQPHNEGYYPEENHPYPIRLEVDERAVKDTRPVIYPPPEDESKPQTLKEVSEMLEEKYQLERERHDDMIKGVGQDRWPEAEKFVQNLEEFLPDK